jgi:hypothetical protein
MKRNPLLTFAMALTPGVLLITGYALIANPESRQAAETASQAPVTAADGTAFRDESRPPVTAAGRIEKSSDGADRWAGNDPAGGSEAGVAASTGKNDESSGGLQPANVPTGATEPNATPGQFQPESDGAFAEAEAPLSSAPIPLAFRPLPPGVAAANPQLAAAVQGLRQDFVNALGGPNQDPNSPTYYKRWIAAQTSVDEQYRVLIGNEAFLAEQMTVNNH